MATIGELKRGLERFNSDKAAADSIENNKGDLLEKNWRQTYDGNANTGDDISPTYFEDPFFKTPQQALSFGSVSVVILSAIGGVWVPVYVMPEILQTLSRFSPMSWGLEAFNDLFLRQASIHAILPNVFRLVGFAFVA